MNFSEHCHLCDNVKTNLDTGIICGLTDSKPNFDVICSKIRLNGKLQEKLERVYLNYEIILQNKKSVFIKFYSFSLIGLVLIFTAIYFLNNIHFSLYTLWFIYLTIGGGLSIISASFYLLNNFRRKLQVAEINKDDLIQLLNIYNIEHDINITFQQKVHGIQDVKIELMLNNRKNRKSTKFYEVSELME